MGSNLGARVLLIIGFLAAMIGYDAWIASHVVLDPNTTRAAAHALLATPAVQRGIGDELHKQIDEHLPDAARDPRIAAAVVAAVRDPRVATAFADTIASIHAAVLSSESASKGENFTLDGRTLTAAVHDALAPSEPALAAQIQQLPPLVVTVKADKLPKLHSARSGADGFMVLAILAALLLITASLLLEHDRRSIMRVGRRTAYLAVTPVILFVVLPRVLEHASGDAPQIASVLLKVYGDRVLPSAIVLALLGVAIVAGAFLLPRGLLARTGAPAPPTAPSGPMYTGPVPSSRPGAPDQPSISEKMYL